jgi:hypothetical protein
VLINAALRKLGVIAEGQAASVNQLLTGAEALNSLIKYMITKGMPIWKTIGYTFTTAANKSIYTIGATGDLITPTPLKVIQAYRVENAGANNIPMTVENLYDYNLLPITATSGEPIKLYYQPLRTTGKLSLWPTPSDANTTITMFYQTAFEDVVNGTDEVDFPSYWTDALVYNLALRLAPEYGTPKDDRYGLAAEAKEYTDGALSYGSEEGSLYLMPDWSGRQGA